MTLSQDRLYELLPAVYQLQDADQGFPLRELLRVIAEQVNLVEEDIEQLYNNWFIETAQEWVIPYLGDLVGYESGFDVGSSGYIDSDTAIGQRLISPRTDVANTIRYRRQRGTLAVLEQIARDVAGWPARAVEFYRLLGLNQALNYQRLERGRLVDLRQGEALLAIGSAFETQAHTVDVRRITAPQSPGRYNITNVGLFLWRLRPYRVECMPAHLIDSNPNCFTFSILENDTPLYLRPFPETDPDHIAEAWNLPIPITRRAMDRWIKTGKFAQIYGPEPEKSFAIWRVNIDRTGKEKPTLVTADQIRAADLSEWGYVPRSVTGKLEVMVDPERGRIAFPANLVPDQVIVTYHYAFADDLGGGMYSRPITEPAQVPHFDKHDILDESKLRSAILYSLTLSLRAILLKKFPWQDADGNRLISSDEVLMQLAGFNATQLLQALNLWVDYDGPVYDVNEDLDGSNWKGMRPETKTRYGEILEGDVNDLDAISTFNRLYLEDFFKGVLRQQLAHYTVKQDAPDSDNDRLYRTIGDALKQWGIDSPRMAVIEIADSGLYEESLKIQIGAHQTLHLRAADRQRPMILLGDTSRARLDALTIEGETGSRLTLDGLLIAGRSIRIKSSGEGILMGEINLRHCTLVPGWMPAVNDDPTCAPRHPEKDSLELINTGARINMDRCILGSIQITEDEVTADPICLRITDSIVDATDSDLDALHGPGKRPAHAVLKVVNSTFFGHSHLHAVQLAENTIFDGRVVAARRQYGCLRFCWLEVDGSRTPRRFNCQPDLAEAHLTAGETEQRIRIRAQVKPRFVSRRYGSPNYAMLARATSDLIRQGADDDSEMGVYHNLFQPQREANLQARLNSFVPAGIDAGLIFVD